MLHAVRIFLDFRDAFFGFNLNFGLESSKHDEIGRFAELKRKFQLILSLKITLKHFLKNLDLTALVII